ncbi:speckle-type poz protein [Anaeramoeba flamelloides]|uniref:Speckle-type poz protein n=1 Tax=Anaeramoeba flamelloides TaxID=1746091 RepID=A0AAV7Y9S0_9EUKA|nr:speckle-type poz protein [Anaeramoeba flamelloides]
MNQPKIYLSAPQPFEKCCSESKLPLWSEVDKIEEPELVKKVAMTLDCFLVWKITGLLQLYQSTKNKFFSYKLPNNETVKDIQAGYQSFLILTECGKVYSIAQLNNLKEIPLSDPNLSKWNLIRHVSFFDENNLFVESITMGDGTNYYKGNYTHLEHSSLTGTGKLSKVFTHVPTLQDYPFTKIQGGQHFFIAQTSDYKLYGWGTQNVFFGNDGFSFEELLKPTKITPPTYFAENNSKKFTISCGSKGIFIYSEYQNSLHDDFKKLFESKRYCDSKINLSNKDEIPCHKLIIELRTNLKFEQIQKIFNQKNFTCEEINCFLQYIYYDHQSNREFLKKIFQSLNLNYPQENDLVSDLLKLYKNEESKDFNILVYEDDDDDDDDEDDDENFEEIPVHKFILLIRSGLFREMFENINEKEQNTNQIKDYSGKTIESLELLIKYLYTDSINLTADDDPKLVLEELGDATEYYQLSGASNLKLELSKIKSQFNI